MTSVRITLVVVAMPLLVGCGTFVDPSTWFEDSGPQYAELIDLDPTLEPVTLWRTDVGAGSDDKRLGLRPAVIGGRIFVAEHGGAVEALDSVTGESLWERSLDLTLTGGPGAGDDLVLLGGEDGVVIALDAETGDERWRAEVGSDIMSAPAAALGIVVVHTIDGRLTGLDAYTGDERWQYDHRAPTLSLHGTGSPVISGATVIAGLSGGKLVALQLDTGQLVWDVQVKVPGGRSELERLADIDGDPLVANGIVYVATYQGDVAAVGEASGGILWRRPLSAYTGLGSDWLQVYLSDAEGKVWALDPDTGAARWRQDQLWGRRLSTPAVLDRYVVVGDFEGYVHWLSQEDGSFVARTRVGSAPIAATPLVVDGRLYVYGGDGDLEAIGLPEPEPEPET